MAAPVAASAAKFAPYILAAIASIPEFYKMYKGGDQFSKMGTMTPEQTNLLNQVMQKLGMGGGLGQGQEEGTDFLRQLMDPSSEAVSQFTEPYMRQFEQETVPGLAERFAGAGALGGGLSSSGFGQSLGAAGSNLQAQLAALKAGLGQQAAGQLMGQYGALTGIGLGAQPFGYVAPQQGFGSGFLSQFGQGIGQQAGKQMFGGL